jgi:hypothetical protein
MGLVDWPAVAARANADGEFRILARFWNASIRLELGSEHLRVAIRHGELAAVEPWSGRIASDLTIAAPEHAWRALLAAVPQPFYHDLAAAAAHHEFDLHGDIRHRCAYYPAVRRLVELMREVHNDA